MKLDTEKEGWLSVFKDWEIKAINHAYDFPEGFESIKIYELMKDEVSRASIINFLNRMDRDGMISSVIRTGKGGKRPFYTPHLSKQEMARLVKNVLNEHLSRLGEVIE